MWTWLSYAGGAVYALQPAEERKWESRISSMCWSGETSEPWALPWRLSSKELAVQRLVSGEPLLVALVNAFLLAKTCKEMSCCFAVWLMLSYFCSVLRAVDEVPALVIPIAWITSASGWQSMNVLRFRKLFLNLAMTFHVLIGPSLSGVR